MAISTPTRHASSNATNNATSYSLGTFTYTAGRLYLLWIKLAETGNAPDPTPDPVGTGQTWTRIDAGELATLTQGLTCYRFLPSSTVTQQNTSTSVLSTTHEGISWAIVEIASGFDTSGTNGSGAITRYQTATATAGLGITMSLSPAPTSPGGYAGGYAGGYGGGGESAVIAAIVHAAHEEATPVAGWSDFATVIDENHISPAQGMTVIYDDTTPGSGPGATWVTSSVSKAMAVELKAAAAGDTTLPHVASPTTLAGGITGIRRTLPHVASSIVLAGSQGTLAAPAVFQWEQSDLDGGGGINAVAASDDGTFLLCGGDVSNLKVSTDSGRTWFNKSRGVPDGGQPKVAGGIVVRPGSNTEALAATKYGLYRTADQGDNWVAVENNSSLSFGEGGGARPRTNTGRIVGASNTYAFGIDLLGDIFRYRWSTQVLTKNLIASRGVDGEGVQVDPIDPTIVYIATRTGLWRMTSAESTPAVAAFTGSGVPTGSYDLTVTEYNGVTYLFAVMPGVGIFRNVGGALNGSWTNIVPAGQASLDWQTLASVTSDDTGVLLAAMCGNAPLIAGGRAHYWYTNNAQSSPPSWTSLTTLVNEKGGPGGDPWWSPLGEGSGGVLPAASNTPVRDANHSAEDAAWFLRGGQYWLLTGGQQGCFLVDRSTNVVYPSMERLGVTLNNHPIVDPNIPGRFYVTNDDHVLYGTVDGGDTWRTLENGMTLGSQPSGNDVALDSGRSPSSVFVAHGHRDDDIDGDIFFHADPFAFTPATRLFVQEGVHAAYGIEVFRAANPVEGGSPTRLFAYIVYRNVGLRRQIFTTATPPVTVGGLDVISNVAGNSSPIQQRTSITWIDNDTLMVFDQTSGIYIVKSARAATPTIWNAWAVVSTESVGGNWIERISASQAMISVALGTDKGVYVVSGLNTATSGDQIGTQLVLTPISRPGGGSWVRPGPIGVRNGTAFIIDTKEKTDPSGDVGVWLSTTSPFTGGYSSIASTASAEVLVSVAGGDIDTQGQIIVSMSGPGAASYRLLAGSSVTTFLTAVAGTVVAAGGVALAKAAIRLNATAGSAVITGGASGLPRTAPAGAGTVAIQPSTEVIRTTLAASAGQVVIAGGQAVVPASLSVLPHSAGYTAIGAFGGWGVDWGNNWGSAVASVATLSGSIVGASGQLAFAGGAAGLLRAVPATAGTVAVQPSTEVILTTLAASAGQFVIAGGQAVVPLHAVAGQLAFTGTPVGLVLTLGETLLGTAASLELVSGGVHVLFIEAVLQSTASLVAVEGGVHTLQMASTAVAGQAALAGGEADVSVPAATGAGQVQVSGGLASLNVAQPVSAGMLEATGGEADVSVLAAVGAGQVQVTGGQASLDFAQNASAGTLEATGGTAVTSSPTPNEAGAVQIIGGESTIVFNMAGNGAEIALAASSATLAWVLGAGAGAITIAMGSIRAEGVPGIEKTGVYSRTIRMPGLAPAPVKSRGSYSTTLTKRGTWEAQ